MINSFPISWTIEPAILHVLLISKRYASISIRFLADSSIKRHYTSPSIDFSILYGPHFDRLSGQFMTLDSPY